MVREGAEISYEAGGREAKADELPGATERKQRSEGGLKL